MLAAIVSLELDALQFLLATRLHVRFGHDHFPLIKLFIFNTLLENTADS